MKKKPARSAPVPGVFYLYGVSQRLRGQPPKIAAEGIDGASEVEAVACGDFWCWVARVSDPRFSDEIRARMEDLEWLAEASLRHQRAVSEIASRKGTTLLPARFGTMFSNLAALEEDVQEKKKDLKAALKKVTDADEWGVKVFVNATQPAAPIVAKSGRDYLQQKAKAISKPGGAPADPEIEDLARQLGKIAKASAPTGKASGAQRGLQWQATFLVPRSRLRQWDAVLRKFAMRWADSRSIESTGPWPPYSFVGDGR